MLIPPYTIIQRGKEIVLKDRHTQKAVSTEPDSHSAFNTLSLLLL